ncbi:hypothetical protein ACIPUC_01700 [Streptomyces sp. LARHCF249]
MRSAVAAFARSNAVPQASAYSARWTVLFAAISRALQTAEHTART